MSGPRVRFAPSPTGSLHLGNARTALFNWLVARREGGTVILRIEDTDRDRHVEGAEAEILADLAWLGLDWDEGPGSGGSCGPYRQSERAALYTEAARRVIQAGAAYRCFCDTESLAAEREQARARGETPRYSRRCAGLDPGESARRAAAGEPSVVRFDGVRAAAGTPEVSFRDRLRGQVSFAAAELGDAVIVRRDGRPTYNFAAVVDDAEMGVDLVLRGDDHLSNTPRQVQLFGALGYALPEFAHLPMVKGADGSRLSKRHGAVSVGEYRRRGYPAAGLINALALLGWASGDDTTLYDREALRETFSLDRVGTSPSTFDPAKLDWICAQHIQRMDVASLSAAVEEELRGAGLLPASGGVATDWLGELAELLRTYLEHFDQVPEQAAPVFTAGGEPADTAAAAVLRDPPARAVVAAIAELAARQKLDTRESWAAFRDAVKERSGARGKGLFRPLRAAITGAISGPELDRLVPLVERGSELYPEHVLPVGERARRTLQWIDETAGAR